MAVIGYERLMSSISKSSGLTISEVEQKVEAKLQRISGLISKEGAAQIVAAELGVSFDKEKLKLNELPQNIRGANVTGKVINIFPVRTFVKNDKESKVANFIIADETSNTRAVLWDTKHIDLIEDGKITPDSIVDISNASVRDGEIHLGSFSELKLSSETLGDVVTEKIFEEKEISSLRISNNASVRAFIAQVFEPKFFNVCLECKKKVTSEGEAYMCNTHGKVDNERRALINLVLDDGTETMRAVFFHETLKELGFDDLQSQEKITIQKDNLIGKEMHFKGVVRLNKFFGNNELIVESVKDVEVDKLISKLES